MSTPTALTTRPKGIIAQLESPEFHAKVALVLGRSMTPERYCSIAVTHVRKNPKLLECDPISFFACTKRAAELGLNLDGRDASLVPYGRECTLLIGYFGEQKIAMRAGNIAKIRAEVICENDEFDHNLGKITRHTWDWRNPRGEVVGAYCQSIFKDGDEQSEILALNDILSCKARSKVQNGAWKTDFAMMARKTAIHRLCRRLPWVDMPDEADDFIDVPAKVEGFSIGTKQLSAPNPEDDIPMNPVPPAETSPIEQKPPATPPKAPEPVRTAPAPASTPKDHLGTIRARLTREGIAESDFAGFQGVAELAALDTSELAKLVLNLDAEIVEYRRPPE